MPARGSRLWTEAYADTSALIAFADGFGQPPPLVTTTLVVAEGHGWFLRRFDTTRALQFLAMVEAFEPTGAPLVIHRH